MCDINKIVQNENSQRIYLGKKEAQLSEIEIVYKIFAR